LKRSKLGYVRVHPAGKKTIVYVLPAPKASATYFIIEIFLPIFLFT
jgi:hypothetical protein